MASTHEETFGGQREYRDFWGERKKTRRAGAEQLLCNGVSTLRNFARVKADAIEADCASVLTPKSATPELMKRLERRMNKGVADVFPQRKQTSQDCVVVSLPQVILPNSYAHIRVLREEIGTGEQYFVAADESAAYKFCHSSLSTESRFAC